MKAYVVIGSNCFTGSHIVEALLAEPDATVVGVSRSAEYPALFLPYRQHPAPGFQFHQLDVVRQPDALLRLLDEVQPQVVISVAALSEVGLSNERPVEYFETNTTATVRLCNHLRQCRYLQRYVHISSAEILGPCAVPVTEEAPFHPSTPYAVSKAAADMYLNVLIRNCAFPATLIRSTNVYGRHQQLFKIIPRTVIYLKQERAIELHGGGTAVKHFVHVRDVVAGLMAALDHGGAGTYHFSTPNDLTIMEVVGRICTMMGHDPASATRVVGERLGQDSAYCLDCSKAERELGWRPRVDFDEGLREVIDWVEGNWESIRRQPLEYVHKV